VHPLDRKLLRELWHLRGQVVAIALVVASGVAVLVMFLSALRSLEATSDAYYERYRFGQVFATVKRAPDHVARTIARIPGVQWVETRIVHFATLDIPGFDEPVVGDLVSIPDHGTAILNRLVMREGRRVAPGRIDEAVINEPFAKAQKLKVGDRIYALINGHRRAVTIVGVALSPEFVYAIGPGALMPDRKRFGVLWMSRKALAAAFDLTDAFNDVSLRLTRGTRPQAVIDRLDRLLARYGSIGAYARADQRSNWFLMNEMTQLRSMSGILPTVFLAVAAFLANMVLGRLIAVERSEIGLLKAFGYSDRAIGWHYAKLVMAITAVGIALGWGLGYWFGHSVTSLYADLFSFPFLYYRPSVGPFAIGALISLGATLAGAAGAIRKAVALPPAEAMRPPAPPAYHRVRVLGRLFAWVDQPTRIILRQLVRWPRRSFLTALGIGMAVALLVSSLQWIDAIDHMIEVTFFDAQHQDVTVSLADTKSSTVVSGFERLPGVLDAEPVRTVPVRLRHGHRSHRGAIEGIRRDARLAPVYDSERGHIPVPPAGLLLSRKLGEKLAVRAGDLVTVEVLEGRRQVFRVPVAGLFESYIGTQAYMRAAALHRLLHERPTATVVHLRVDRRRERDLFRALKRVPAVTSVLIRLAAVKIFRETMAESLWISIAIFIGFASAIALGVVYNSARIALSERGRELATLRVLGFTRGEVAYILLGEVALITLVALPLGCLLGRLLSALLVTEMETELYRVPMIIEASTYGVSILVGLAAAAVSAALVRRRLDSLDMIAVLKTRE
jgi:putative ABC transport system permease protein